jgi:predicted Kef-type K+ transport protein
LEKKSELKERVVAWLYPEMIEKMNNLMENNNMRNHTEFVEQAVNFYIGYLSAQDSTMYLSKIILGAIQGVLKETENRQSNNLFRLSVEMSMMMNILAAGLEIGDEDLRKLRGRCVNEVKKTKGRISMEDAVKFQQGIEE